MREVSQWIDTKSRISKAGRKKEERIEGVCIKERKGKSDSLLLASNLSHQYIDLRTSAMVYTLVNLSLIHLGTKSLVMLWCGIPMVFKSFDSQGIPSHRQGSWSLPS